MSAYTKPKTELVFSRFNIIQQRTIALQQLFISKGAVFITKNGYSDLVVMSIETYESMLETAETNAAILEEEAEYA